MVTYGTTAIPSDQITVLSGGTVSVSAAFENSVGLIGGMDVPSGNATAGDVTTVSSSTDAATKFGEDSELHEAVQLAFQNGAGTIYALPVPEKSVTTETQTTQGGVLDNAPVFDPRVNEEHSITATDTGAGDANVNLVDEPPTSAPSTADQIDVYPPTGEYFADSAPDGDYEFDYDYGDYSVSAVKPLLDESPRIVTLLGESTSAANDIVGELNSRATNFDFMHLVTGATVNVDPASYTDGVDERRMSLVYPSRGYTDAAETNEERTSAAVAGELASLALGLSSTNNSLGGFSALKNSIGGPTSAGDLIDAQVMPLLDYPPTTIIKDMTTSTEPKFERVYGMQIIDEAAELSHIISREFIGNQNTVANRTALQRSHRNAYISITDASIPLLDGYEVSVEQDSADANTVNIDIGLDVVDVMDTIDVTITVGDIVRSGGAT